MNIWNLAAILVSVAVVESADAGEIDLRITGFSSDIGRARIVLMEGPEGYAGARPAALITSVPIRSGKAIWQADIPDGIYAVIAHHDANQDDTMNRPVFGLPLEPYGYSNGAWTSMGLPAFDTVAIEVGKGTTHQAIHLRTNAFVSLGQIGLVGLVLLATVLGIPALRRRFAPHSKLSQNGEYS